MNETNKKYSKLLSQILLSVPKKEADEYLEAFVNRLKQEGKIYSSESILREALNLAEREIENSTVTLRRSKNISESLIKELVDKIASQMREEGKVKFFIEEKTDKELLGGAIIDFPGKRIDSSLSGRLNNLSKELKS